MTITQLAPLPLEHLRRGKVREVYIVDDDRLLLVATDRVSAFDVVMSEAIPYKGAVLTQITVVAAPARGDVTHHMLSSDVDEIVEAIPSLADHRQRSRVARCSVGERRCFPSSASSAVISPARRGRSTARVERWPVSRCRRICVKATVSIRRSLARRRKPSPGTMRTSRSRASSRSSDRTSPRSSSG